LDQFGKIDSKFRYVIVAAKRAKQLLRGAKPKVKAKTRNPIRLAQIEVKEGAIEFEILHDVREDVLDPEEVFTADDVDEGDEGGGGSDEETAGEEDVVGEEEEGGFEEDLPEVELSEEKEEG
jgi:DNA-directed RNA polymerase omega subunit